MGKCQNGKVSEWESVRTWKCQNPFFSLFGKKMGKKCQNPFFQLNWKVPEKGILTLSNSDTFPFWHFTVPPRNFTCDLFWSLVKISSHWRWKGERQNVSKNPTPVRNWFPTSSKLFSYPEFPPPPFFSWETESLRKCVFFAFWSVFSASHPSNFHSWQTCLTSSPSMHGPNLKSLDLKKRERGAFW